MNALGLYGYPLTHQGLGKGAPDSDSLPSMQQQLHRMNICMGHTTSTVLDQTCDMKAWIAVPQMVLSAFMKVNDR